MIAPPVSGRVIAGPDKVRGEYRWTVELEDGTRGVVAQYDRKTRRLTVWATTQAPASLRGGLSALLGMLNSCAAGLTVVNIDNGFGAAIAAASANRLANGK